jgi:hypothetical protein
MYLQSDDVLCWVGIKGGTATQGVSDGYWVLLQPLSTGSHNIHFSGLSTDVMGTSAGNYSTEVTYPDSSMNPYCIANFRFILNFVSPITSLMELGF